MEERQAVARQLPLDPRLERRPGSRSARFPYTPLVSEMYALESALTQILEEGVGVAGRAAPADRRRLPNRSQGARSRALAGREEIAAPCVTAIRMPEGLTDAGVRTTMRERYGVMISPGYGELQGTVDPAQPHGRAGPADDAGGAVGRLRASAQGLRLPGPARRGCRRDNGGIGLARRLIRIVLIAAVLLASLLFVDRIQPLLAAPLRRSPARH